MLITEVGDDGHVQIYTIFLLISVFEYVHNIKFFLTIVNIMLLR